MSQKEIAFSDKKKKEYRRVFRQMTTTYLDEEMYSLMSVSGLNHFIMWMEIQLTKEKDNGEDE